MRVFFNHRRQWLEVEFHDVSANTFQRRNGTRWGYFEAKYEHPRRGFFGEIHLLVSRRRPIRQDTVAHELFHAHAEWMRSKNVALSVYNEERLATLMDELTRNFWKTYEKENK